jgi:hypothetical protein
VFGIVDDGDVLVVVRCLRRLRTMQQTITADRAMVLVAPLFDAVRRPVDDRAVLDAIGREVERIVVADGAVAPVSDG